MQSPVGWLPAPALSAPGLQEPSHVFSLPGRERCSSHNKHIHWWRKDKEVLCPCTSEFHLRKSGKEGLRGGEGRSLGPVRNVTFCICMLPCFVIQSWFVLLLATLLMSLKILPINQFLFLSATDFCHLIHFLGYFTYFFHLVTHMRMSLCHITNRVFFLHIYKCITLWFGHLHFSQHKVKQKLECVIHWVRVPIQKGSAAALWWYENNAMDVICFCHCSVCYVAICLIKHKAT